MAGLPTVGIYLDNGTGTFPIDVTTQVRLIDGYSLSGFGRSDEFSSADASTLTFTVDNIDGSFTSGVGFGMGGFGAGFFGGLVPAAPGTGVRITVTSGATTVNRFTGRIATLELGWPGGGQEFSTVEITCADRLADLGDRRPLRSMLEQEILLDSPTAYYTLGEAEGSTSAGDTSGHGALPLTTAGTGTAVTFGTGVGPTDGLTAPTFAGGQYLSALSAPVGTGSFSVAVFFSTTTIPGVAEVMPILSAYTGSVNTTNFQIEIGGTGAVAGYVGSFGVGGSTSSVADGRVHCVVLTFDSSTGFGRSYVDGVATGFSGLAGTGLPAQDLTVGWNLNPNHLGNPHFTGVISHVAVFDGIVLSAGRAAAYAAALTGFAEDTAARFSRIASYAGLTGTTTSGSGQQVSLQDTTGQSVLSALQDVANAEEGVMYADGSGNLQLQGRGYRALKTVATLALPAEEPDPGTTIPYDTSQLINQVTVTRVGGATQTVTDPSATSPSGPGVFAQSLDLIVSTDQAALERAQWIVGKYKTPAPRIASLTVNPLAPVTSAASILALNIGDRISLTLPSQQWAGSGDYVIEGWSETISADSWSITYNVLPWCLFQSGIYDDAGSLYDSAVYA